MREKKTRNGLSFLLALIMAFGVIATAPVTAAANEESPQAVFSDSVYAQKELVNPEYIDGLEYNAEAAGLDKEALTYLEAFVASMDENLGVYGFEGEYAVTDQDEIVDVQIMFNTLPSEIINIYNKVHKLKVDEAKAVKIAKAAATAFRAQVKALRLNEIEIVGEANYLVNMVNAKLPARLLEKVSKIPGVLSVTPNTTYYALDDPSYSDFTGIGMKESRELLKTDYLNDLGYTGEGIKVGILDTGTDYNHPDLKPAYDFSNTTFRKDSPSNRGPSSSIGYDFVNYDTDPMETTYAEWQISGQPEIGSNGSEYYTSHGTHVAGTVGGRGVNDSTYATLGMAPKAHLMTYKVLGPYGSGSQTGIIYAIERAVSDGCKVVNMSLGGGTSYYGNETVAVNNGILAGTVFCISAGNDGTSASGAYPIIKSVGQPGTTMLALTVAASNYGGGSFYVYPDAVSTSAADGDPTSFAFNVEGRDFSNTFNDNEIIAPNLTKVDGQYRYVLKTMANYEPLLTLAELKATGAAGSLEGCILVLRRGMSFTDMVEGARYFKAGAVMILNRADAAGMDSFVTGITIGGEMMNHMPVLTTTGRTALQIVEAVKRADAASAATYINLGNLSVIPQDGTVASFSSIGPLSDANITLKPDIIAPGVAIMSTQPAYIVNPDHNTTNFSFAYGRMQGTSMSCPHLTGISALMVQAYPNATPQEIKARLMNTSVPMPTETSVTESGAGLVDPVRAILTNKSSYVTVTDSIYTNSQTRTGSYDLASLSFGETTKAGANEVYSKELPLVIHNTSGVESTFTFSYRPVDTTPLFSLNSTANGVRPVVSEESITVPAGQTGTVRVKMAYPGSAVSDNTKLYEGRLVVTNTANGEEYVVPYGGRLRLGANDIIVSGAYIPKPVLSGSAANQASTYSAAASSVITYMGKPKQVDLYVTDLNDEPVAYYGTTTVSTNKSALSDLVIMNSITRTAFAALPGGGYASTKTAIADGVYKLNIKITAANNTTIYNMYAGKFVIDSTRPVLTFDNSKPLEYDAGLDKLTLKGNIYSRAAELCAENGVEFGIYQGNPVIGQEMNVLSIGGTIYSYCDENGDFEIPYSVTEASRTGLVTVNNIYAMDLYTLGYRTATLTENYGNNRTEGTISFQYTEAAKILSATVTNGVVQGLLSKVPASVPNSGEFVVEYSLNGSPKALLPAAYSFSGSTATFTFEPFAETDATQTLEVFVTYRGITVSGSCTIEPLTEEPELVQFTASNGTASATFNIAPSPAPVANDFTLEYSVNGSAKTTLPSTYRFENVTAAFTFTPFAQTYDVQNVVIFVTYNGVTLNASFVVEALERPAALETVTASNGTATAELDKIPSAAPAASDFTVEYSINGSARAALASSYSFVGKTATFTFTPFVQTFEVQNVVVYVTYGGVTLNAEFTIEALERPAVLESVTATNGIVIAVLDKAPSVAPAASDFTVEYSINGSGYLPLTNDYSFAEKTATFTFTPFEKTDVVQNVSFKVSYNGGEAMYAEIVIPAETGDAPVLVGFTAVNGTAVATLDIEPETAPAASEFVLEYSINGGAKQYLSADFSFSGNKASFAFAQFNRSTVDQTIMIYVTYNGVTMSHSFNLAKWLRATSIKLNFTGITNVVKGKQVTISLKEVLPDGVIEEGTPYVLTFTSASTKIASVDEEGIVTANYPGSTVITVKYINAYGDVLTATAMIKVTN